MSYLKRFQANIGRQIDRNFAAILVICFFVSGLNYWIITQVAEQLEQDINQTPIATKATPLVTRVITSTIAPSATPTPTATRTPAPKITVTPTLPWDLALDMYFATAPYPMMRMPAEWDVSLDGVKYIEFWEGFYSSKYDDGGPGVGNCTIGFGHLLHLGICNGSEGVGTFGSAGSISQPEAERLLKADLENCAMYVDKYVTVRVSQNQYNILTSLVCGVGYERFQSYKFTALLNQRLYAEAATQLRQTGVCGIGIGCPLPGLVRRRTYEADRFVTNIPLWPIPPGY